MSANGATKRDLFKAIENYQNKIVVLEHQLALAREGLEKIKLMVDSQARDEGLWSIPWEGLQPISEAHLQQELRRLHECIENTLAKLSETK